MVPRSEIKWRMAVSAQELQDKKWTFLSCLCLLSLLTQPHCTVYLCPLGYPAWQPETLGPVLTWPTPARLSHSEEARLPEGFSLGPRRSFRGDIKRESPLAGASPSYLGGKGSRFGIDH